VLYYDVLLPLCIVVLISMLRMYICLLYRTHYVNVANKSFENIAQFKYIEITPTKIICILVCSLMAGLVTLTQII